MAVELAHKARRKKVIIHEGGAAPAELRELESRGTVMAAEKRLEQSTLSFVVNSASTSSSSRPPEDNSVSMVLYRVS